MQLTFTAFWLLLYGAGAVIALLTAYLLVLPKMVFQGPQLFGVRIDHFMMAGLGGATALLGVARLYIEAVPNFATPAARTGLDLLSIPCFVLAVAGFVPTIRRVRAWLDKSRARKARKHEAAG